MKTTIKKKKKYVSLLFENFGKSQRILVSYPIRNNRCVVLPLRLLSLLNIRRFCQLLNSEIVVGNSKNQETQVQEYVLRW